MEEELKQENMPINTEAEMLPTKNEPDAPPAEEPDSLPAKEPDSGEAMASELLAELKKLSEQQTRQLEQLDKKFDEKIAEDSTLKENNDILWKDLQSYKNDLYSNILKPFVLAAISLLDDINSTLRDLPEGDASTPAVRTHLESISESLLDILKYNGVEEYESEDPVFDSRTQQLLKRVPSETPDLHNQIASRISKGYRWQGVILKKEYVTVYK